jgi:hypothetical protein
MAKEKPLWGASRIHGELKKLGIDVSERSVSRYLAKIRPEPPGNKLKKWMTFLKNQGIGGLHHKYIWEKTLDSHTFLTQFQTVSINGERQPGILFLSFPCLLFLLKKIFVICFFFDIT